MKKMEEKLTETNFEEQPSTDNLAALSKLAAVAERTGVEKENGLVSRLRYHKKGLLGFVIVLALVGGGIVGVRSIPKVVKVNYSETYRMAKKIRAKVATMKNDASCENVEEYAGSVITKAKDYAEYLEKCKLQGQDIPEMLEILGKTEGVRQNEELRHKYVELEQTFKKGLKRDQENLEKTLKLYQLWHDFALGTDKLSSFDQADTDLVAVAEPLIESGNEKLKAYGETWAIKKMAAAKAYREYHANFMNMEVKDRLLAEKTQKENEYNTWVSAYKPNMKETAPLETIKVLSLYNEYENFYSNVKDVYQRNYNPESKDCWALGDQVVCE